MKFKKAVPVIGILSLVVAGVGFAHGSTTLSKQSATPTRLASATNPEMTEENLDIRTKIARLEKRLKTLRSEDSSNPDRKADISAVRSEIAKLRSRLKTLRSEGSSNPDRKADISAVRSEIAKLRERLETLRSEDSKNPDRKADIAAVKKKIAVLRNQLREMRTENRFDSDRAERDFQDRESPEAALHHDGDDHHPDGGRLAALAPGLHREATREIMQGSHERIVALYAPAHHVGYHARMHRHSR